MENEVGCRPLSSEKHTGRKLFISEFGGVAQLGERLPCTQKVAGSFPVISTTTFFGSNRINSTNFYIYTIYTMEKIYEKMQEHRM